MKTQITSTLLAGVLQGDTLAPHLFIIYLYYVLRTSIDIMKDKRFQADKGKKQKIRGSLNKFPDIFRMGTFIDSYIHEILVPFEVISSGCNAFVVTFQQLLEGPIEVLLCEHVNGLRHSLFHLRNCLITTATELRE